jgi:hypothetical protein
MLIFDLSRDNYLSKLINVEVYINCSVYFNKNCTFVKAVVHTLVTSTSSATGPITSTTASGILFFSSVITSATASA